MRSSNKEKKSEIKLRFVDSDGTVFKPVSLLELCQNLEFPGRTVLEAANGDFYDADDFLDAFERGDFTINLWTGSIDRNYREIYEGDIVKDQFFLNEGVIEGIQFGIRPTKTLTDADGKEALIFTPETQEVVGDIYRTPELLEDKNDGR